MKTPKAKKPAKIDLSKCEVGQCVKLRNGRISTLVVINEGGTNYPFSSNRYSWSKNGEFWRGDSNDLDVVAILPLTKPMASAPVVKAWMVVDENGELYSASNGGTKAEAKMHHIGSLSFMSWEDAIKRGDRLVRVEIRIVSKTK